MARDLTVEEMVAAELQRDSRATVEDLHFLAGRIDPAVNEMSAAEFEERYLSNQDGSPAAASRAPRRKGARRKPGKRAPAKRPAAAKSPRGRKSSESRASRAPRTDRARTDRAPAGGSTPDAEHVRAVLNDFARELAGAEKPAHVIRVMASLDKYVKKIVG